MRRTGVAVTTIVMALIAGTGASANGGAYITFDEAYYLPGARVEAEAYVTVPAGKAGLLEDGPFTLYALPSGSELRQGGPVPADAVPLGAFVIHEERREQFELTSAFTLPSLPPGAYTIAMCSPGCALTGFGEPLTGSFTVVATAREAELLVRNGKLESAVANLERGLKKAERQIDELDAALTRANASREALVDEAAVASQEASAQAAGVQAAADRTSDALFRWRVFALVAAVAATVSFALWLTAARRRSHTATVSDAPSELLGPAG